MVRQMKSTRIYKSPRPKFNTPEERWDYYAPLRAGRILKQFELMGNLENPTLYKPKDVSEVRRLMSMLLDGLSQVERRLAKHEQRMQRMHRQVRPERDLTGEVRRVMQAH